MRKRTLIAIPFILAFTVLCGIGVYTRLYVNRVLPPSSLPSPVRIPAADPVKDDGDVLAHQRTVKKCRDEGHIPVVGFGISCVCLYREAVAWSGE